MERLIENKLLYGKLFLVDQPHLVERYNRALAAFGLEPTRLNAFGIDATGFSPEVAAELVDGLYLNPFGVNRRFIILSPDQVRLPVVASNFTSTAELMQAFMRENAEALRVLTLKDVVYGEIEDSTLRVDSIDDLLTIRHVEFTVKTSTGLIDKARRLTSLAADFELQPDGWRDQASITEMLELARDCGDVRRNEMVPRKLHFEHPSYWTSHYGGLYIFHDETGPTVIGSEAIPAFAGDSPVPYWYIPLTSARTVFAFLESSGRLEPFNRDWLSHSGVIDRRIDQFVRFLIARHDPDRDVAEMDQIALKNWLNRNSAALAGDGSLDFLYALRRAVRNQIEGYGDNVPWHLRFLAHRARPDRPDRLLVNRLIAEYVPFDFLMRFVVNKDAFYRDYLGYPERFRDFVIDTMRSTYLPDKRAFRAKLFEDWGMTSDA